MSAMASQSTGVSIAQPFAQGQTNENTKAPRHWPLWGESTVGRWIPLTKGQLRGNDSICWRDHVTNISFDCYTNCSQ